MRILWSALLLMLLLPSLLACAASESPDRDRAALAGEPALTLTATATPQPTATTTPKPMPSQTATRVIPTAPTTTRAPAPTVPPVQRPSYIPVPQAARPVRLKIPRLGVDAAIVQVGLDQAGRMAVPEEVEEVAWFQYGAKPARPGNAVLSGHLDDFRQQPAVFWRLHELQPGDEILVEDAAGATHRFEVAGQEIYDAEEAPIEQIFGFTTDRNLNLITCNGIWDEASQNYDRRLVVYAKAVDSTTASSE